MISDYVYMHRIFQYFFPYLEIYTIPIPTKLFTWPKKNDYSTNIPIYMQSFPLLQWEWEPQEVQRQWS